MTSNAFALLQRFLRETCGMVVEEERRYLLEDRLKPLLRAEKLASIDDLALALQAAPRSELARNVVETVTINETSFFRDRALFQVFADELLPDLVRSRAESRRLRIWCAACSTGQEPYSLAMLLDENMRQLGGWQVEIIGTDISRQVLETAKAGLYSQFEVQRGLPVTMLLRNFRREEEQWRISDYLRANISFRVHNLLESPREFGKFDVIFCRNVLLYFDPTTKRRVLSHLTNALADDGYLALGAAERVSGVTDTLVPYTTNFIFRKDPARASAGSRDIRRVVA